MYVNEGKTYPTRGLKIVDEEGHRVDQRIPVTREGKKGWRSRDRRDQGGWGNGIMGESIKHTVFRNIHDDI